MEPKVDLLSPSEGLELDVLLHMQTVNFLGTINQQCIMTANPRVFLLFTTCDRKDFEKFTLLRKFPFFEKFPLMRQLIIFASTFASIQSRPPWTALEHCKKVTVKALYAKDVCQVLRAYDVIQNCQYDVSAKAAAVLHQSAPLRRQPRY